MTDRWDEQCPMRGPSLTHMPAPLNGTVCQYCNVTLGFRGLYDAGANSPTSTPGGRTTSATITQLGAAWPDVDSLFAAAEEPSEHYLTRSVRHWTASRQAEQTLRPILAGRHRLAQRILEQAALAERKDASSW